MIIQRKLRGIGNGCWSTHLPRPAIYSTTERINMKFLTAAALVASCSAFAPSQQSARSVTSLNAERSKSLPFMNRPALVSPTGVNKGVVFRG